MSLCQKVWTLRFVAKIIAVIAIIVFTKACSCNALEFNHNVSEEVTLKERGKYGYQYQVIEIPSTLHVQLNRDFPFDNSTPVLPFPFGSPPAEAFMTTPQMIRNHGYEVEEHTFQTEDGYILTLFRIPHGKTWSNFNADGSPNSTFNSKEPILFTHGLLSSSDDWLFHKKASDNLALMLSEMGYDIWLGNVRGNNYCLNHIYLNQYESQFWKFNVDDMGIYDAPTMITYILSKTGKSQLSYVGHSMGASMFFIAMDKYPHLQSRIKKMIALAPAVYISRTIAPIKILELLPAPLFLLFQEVISSGRVFPIHFNRAIHRFGPYLCLGYIPGIPCALLMSFFAGYDLSQMDDTTASMVYGHAPSIGSAMTLVQFQQWMINGVFNAYDYGTTENLRRYRSVVPPLYNLGKIHVPIYIFNGPNDWLVTPPDVQKLRSELPNVILQEPVSYKEFAHLDFVYAKDARVLIYERIVQFF